MMFNNRYSPGAKVLIFYKCKIIEVGNSLFKLYLPECALFGMTSLYK